MENVVLDINIYTHAVGATPRTKWDASILNDLAFMRTAQRVGYQAEALILSALVSLTAAGKNQWAVHANDHIFRHIVVHLSRPKQEEGYGWTEAAAADYVTWLKGFLPTTGGTINTPVEEDPNVLSTLVTDKDLRRAGIEKDTEDTRVVALARDTGSTVIATQDSKFRKLSPWRGIISIESASDFVRRLTA